MSFAPESIAVPWFPGAGDLIINPDTGGMYGAGYARVPVKTMSTFHTMPFVDESGHAQSHQIVLMLPVALLGDTAMSYTVEPVIDFTSPAYDPFFGGGGV